MHTSYCYTVISFLILFWVKREGVLVLLMLIGKCFGFIPKSDIIFTDLFDADHECSLLWCVLLRAEVLVDYSIRDWLFLVNENFVPCVLTCFSFTQFVRMMINEVFGRSLIVIFHFDNC